MMDEQKYASVRVNRERAPSKLALKKFLLIRSVWKRDEKSCVLREN